MRLFFILSLSVLLTLLFFVAFLLSKERKDKPEAPSIEPIRPRSVLVIRTGDKVFYASHENNFSSESFVKKNSSAGLTVNLREDDGAAKIGELPFSLPKNDGPIATSPGDVILYAENRIAICYEKNACNLTRLASIGNTSKEELLDLLGKEEGKVSFSLEWDE